MSYIVDVANLLMNRDVQIPFFLPISNTRAFHIERYQCVIEPKTVVELVSYNSPSMDCYYSDELKLYVA